MKKLSPEQESVVRLPLDPFSVTACAGSGKTFTAVHRLAEMRRLLVDQHGMVALLSFSNVAVDTFRHEYLTLMRSVQAGRRSHAVEIDTFDGFIVSNVLRPHGHRSMKAKCTPYLVDGREPFLKSFTVFDGKQSRPTADLNINLLGGKFRFTVGNANAVVPESNAKQAIAKLAGHGAYTHDSARYWVLITLLKEPFVLRALSRRYPHILVDEAQDIGPMHHAILKLLVKAGSTLSLIGDPNQGIYEFQGANGVFLREYGAATGVTPKELSTNFRSVPSIVEVANKLSDRRDKPDRPEPKELSGAYFIPFRKGEKHNALATFQSMLKSAGIDENNAVVLCRSSDWVLEWSGGQDAQGQGVVRSFAQAVIHRDKLKNLHKAYEFTCLGVVGLLGDRHRDLISKLTKSTPSPDMLALRRTIWSFARDANTGLPSGSLQADTEWLSLMASRAKSFVAKLCVEFSLTAGDNLSHKLTKRDLESRPIVQLVDLAQTKVPVFRVSTVHKVKGESIEAVMYVANKEHATLMLEGTATEVGRIGYVALTRARNLFVIAVPENALPELEPALLSRGFRKAGT